jgi:alanine racemase
VTFARALGILPAMPRPIRATIDAAAFAHNLALARAQAGQARIWAVLKAGAYGHGLLRSAKALAAADGFAILDLAEAVALRADGVRKPILMLEGFFDRGDRRKARSLVEKTHQINGYAIGDYLTREKHPNVPGAYWDTDVKNGCASIVAV